MSRIVKRTEHRERGKCSLSSLFQARNRQARRSLFLSKSCWEAGLPGSTGKYCPCRSSPSFHLRDQVGLFLPAHKPPKPDNVCPSTCRNWPAWPGCLPTYLWLLPRHPPGLDEQGQTRSDLPTGETPAATTQMGVFYSLLFFRDIFPGYQEGYIFLQSWIQHPSEACEHVRFSHHRKGQSFPLLLPP